MSELDNDELIATRRLNGVDDGLYESNKNVANIEEDVKYVKECLEIARIFFNVIKSETDYKDVDEIAFSEAIEHILAEREAGKKRIKELEDDLYIADYKIESSIPIEKINNQIDKYKHMLELTTYGELQKYTPGEIILKISTLEELLEDK